MYALVGLYASYVWRKRPFVALAAPFVAAAGGFVYGLLSGGLTFLPVSRKHCRQPDYFAVRAILVDVC